MSATGGGRVGDDIAFMNALTFDDRRALVDTGALVGALVFAQIVGLIDVVAVATTICFPVTETTCPSSSATTT